MELADSAPTSCGEAPLACATGELFTSLVDCINTAADGNGRAHGFLFDGSGRERHYFAIDGDVRVLNGYIGETSDYGNESTCSSLVISSDGTCPDVEAQNCVSVRDY